MTTDFKNFFCLGEHALVKHKLTIIRDRETDSKNFREVVEEITLLVAAEALKNLKSKPKTVQTPIAEYKGIKANKVTLIPVIRAGLAMMSPLQKLLPDAKVGFIGLSRDHKTLKTNEYYENIPEIHEDETALILDPMLATGNTVVHTIKHLKNKGVKNIIVIGILSTPVAIKQIFETCPNCLVYSADIDIELNDKGYIVPGLGDAGDRIFNTE